MRTRGSLLLALGMLLGCTARRATGAQCVLASECADGLACLAGACRSQCQQDRDCPSGQLCVAGSAPGANVCFGADSPSLCASNADCPAGRVCSARGFCSRPCTANDQCASLNPGALCTTAGLCELPLSRPSTVDVVLPEAALDALDSSPDGVLDASADASTPDAASLDASAPDGCAPPSLSPCTAPLMVCGGSCLDTSWDPAHCGACTANCGGNYCVASQCKGYRVRELVGFGYGMCARVTDASSSYALCWGANLVGQLGNGSSLEVGAPTRNANLDGVQSLAGSDGAGCGLFADGSTRCWGRAMGGLPGVASADAGAYTERNALSPQRVLVPDALSQVSVGTRFACGVSQSAAANPGAVYCWGEDRLNQLADGHSADTPSRFGPPTRINLPRRAQRVVVLEDSACALLQNAAGDTSPNVFCWGNTYPGQLGRPLLPGDTGLPAAVALPAGHVALDLALATDHACAILENQSIVCWGDNTGGRLGASSFTATSSETPVPVNRAWPASETPARLLAWPFAMCVVMQSGRAWCWGDANGNPLGSSRACSASSTPVPFDYLPSAPTAVGLDNGYLCFLLESGGVRCWYQESSTLTFRTPALP